MPSLNKVILLGTLPRDPAFKFTPHGAPLCTVDLSLPEIPGTTISERQSACTIRVVVWGKQADAGGQSLTGGPRAD